MLGVMAKNARTTVLFRAQDKKLIHDLTKAVAKSTQISPTRDEIIRLALPALARELGIWSVRVQHDDAPEAPPPGCGGGAL